LLYYPRLENFWAGKAFRLTLDSNVINFRKRLRTSSWARSARDLFALAASISDSPFTSICRNLTDLHIDKVIDVGANVGQFGLDMRRKGFRGLIISYEPVKETFMKLNESIRYHQPWRSFQLGLGSIESQVEINVSANDSLSSSILAMGQLHVETFPNSVTIRKEEIIISTIDLQIELLGLIPEELMLKLDVQGFEYEVLKGASKSLPRIPLCYLEVSLIPLYEGEQSLLPIMMELSKYGHEVIDVFRGVKSRNGQLLQVDILTRRSNK